MKSRVQNAVAVLCMTWGAALASEAVQPPRAESPREVLERAGYREVYRRWLCRQEVRLLRQLERLKPLEESHHRSRRRWQTLGDAQHQLRKRIDLANVAIERLDAKIASSPAEPLRRQRLEDQQRELRRQLVEHRQRLFRELEGVNEQSKLSLAARHHASTRTRLEAACIALRAGAAEASTWYRHPVGDRVEAALDALKPENEDLPRLGPAKDYRREIPPLMEPIEQMLRRREIPIFREAGRFHVPAVLNETSPLTFAVEDEVAISAVPAPLLVAAGVDMTAVSEVRIIALEDRQISGRAVRIARLRLGPLVLRDVPCLATDPIDDDAGSVLAAVVLDGRGVEWDYERLELRVPAE